MHIHIKYFAAIREALGRSGETLQTNAATLGALRDELLERGGAYQASLARSQPVRVALNQVMSNDAALLQDGAEVAFFPPVTGG